MPAGALSWDNVGDRFFETGVDKAVLYIPTAGVYDDGVAWNGLVSVSESPSGAEATAQYADNIKYLDLRSAEEFGATIEAFTYPVEFEQFDGISSPQQRNQHWSAEPTHVWSELSHSRR